MELYVQGQVSPLMHKSLQLHWSCEKGSPAVGEDLAWGNASSQRIFSRAKA